jgi:hypothetical protein
LFEEQRALRSCGSPQSIVKGAWRHLIGPSGIVPGAVLGSVPTALQSPPRGHQAPSRPLAQAVAVSFSFLRQPPGEVTISQCHEF